MFAGHVIIVKDAQAVREEEGFVYLFLSGIVVLENEEWLISKSGNNRGVASNT